MIVDCVDAISIVTDHTDRMSEIWNNKEASVELRMFGLAQRADRVAGLAHAASVGRHDDHAQIMLAIDELVEAAALIDDPLPGDARPLGLRDMTFLRHALRGAIGSEIGPHQVAGLTDALLDDLAELVLLKFGHLKLEPRR